MIFWTREIAGWALLGLGLAAFAAVYQLAQEYKVLEVGALTLVGIFLFRGGIHLLKVAIAARVCLHAQAEIRSQAPGKRKSDGAVA